MRPFAFFTVAVLCICGAAIGQQKEMLDVYAVVGAGIGVGGLDVGASQSWTAPEALGGYLTKTTDNYLNFGSGLQLEGGADIRIMQHLYGQAALCYGNGLWGIDQVVVNKYTPGVTTTDQCSYSTLGIKLLVKPTFQVLDLFTVYTGFGIGLDFAWLTIHHSQVGPGAVNLSARADDGEWPAFAFEGSLGLDYPITRSIIVFGELQCEVMNFMTSQRTITNSNFVTDPDWTNQIKNYQTNATDRDPPNSTPGTNVGIRVGVKFPLM
jgi:opacity protein-like surface antigen